MMNKKIKLFLMILFAGSVFMTCDYENGLIRTWWEEENENEYEYVGILKYVPTIEYIYDSVVDIKPNVQLQELNIIVIEYILFSGDQHLYNSDAKPPSVSSITEINKINNDLFVHSIANELKDNPEFLIILHGHANPSSFTEGEIEELMWLSRKRAEEVNNELKTIYNSFPDPKPPLDERVSVRGYGGERTQSSGTNASLNRRVEMILIEIQTITIP